MGTTLTIIFLIIVGILAGIVSAVASMASLVSYPALLIAGCNPITANITSTASLIFTGPGVLLASFRKMRHHWGEFVRYSALLLTGSIIGSLLLVEFPSTVFEKIVPFFVLLSALGLLIGSRRKAVYHGKKRTKNKTILAYLGLFIGGIYSGYFGAAAGVIHLICMNYLSDDEFFTVNAMKDIIGALANFVALVVFIFTAQVNWMMALSMAVGLFIGGYLGQYSEKFLSLKVVSEITFAFSLVLTGWLFYQGYIG